MVVTSTEKQDWPTFRQTVDRSIVDYMARCRLLRAPSEAEHRALFQSLQEDGLAAAMRLLDVYADNEQIESLARSTVIGRALSTFTFYQKDMGFLNDLHETEVFIISAPKCGTTTLADSFRRSGMRVFSIHNDAWLRYYMPSGEILDGLDIKFDEIFTYLKPRRPTIYFGFRDPISWYFALAGEMHLPMDTALRDRLPVLIEQQFPWRVLSFEASKKILETIIGKSIFELHFDQEAGFSVNEMETVDIVLYRIEALDSLLSWLVDAGKISSAERKRVNTSGHYREFVDSSKYDIGVLNSLFDRPMVEFFYSRKMIQDFKNRYQS